MKYLFLYKYLHVHVAKASTNWTNWTNTRGDRRLFQLFQFVLALGACMRAHIWRHAVLYQAGLRRAEPHRVELRPAGRRACFAAGKARGSSLDPPLGAGNSGPGFALVGGFFYGVNDD